MEAAQELCWKRHQKQYVCRECLRDIAYVVGQEVMGVVIDSQEEQITELKAKVKRLVEVHVCQGAMDVRNCKVCMEAARG